MRTVVHLEPEDFARELVHNPKNVCEYPSDNP